MTNSNLYLDINVLQTVPSSNLNRDDTGAPKTALYGGVSRARVSSQSWKSAMRKFFSANAVPTGKRTKRAASFLAQILGELDPDLDEVSAMQKAKEIFKVAGIKLNKDNMTGALLFISRGQMERVAQYALDHDDLDKKDVKKALNGNQSLDLALFGRMVADNPELNVEGSAQVAHAISTHEVIPEYDYFTALDDLKPDDNAGAAMLGTIEFDSATLYRYANLNVNELIHNVGCDEAILGAEQFVKSFALSMPTGKQNTFANKTLPNYLMVTLRTDTPVNLVSAFEEPIESRTGYMAASIKRIEHEYQVTEQFVDQPLLTAIVSQEKSVLDAKVSNLTELLTQLSDMLKKVVPDEDNNN